MGRGRRGVLGALAVLLASVALGGSSAAAPTPGVAWTEFLPALPSPAKARSGGVAHCKRARLRCVRVQIRRMRELQGRLGCDHRAVFATTYLELTRELRDKIVSGELRLQFPKYFFREDALFANVYFRTIRRWESGRAVPDAWRIAFETAESGEVNAAQDMLLGINAHVQNDMPFVLAQLGLRTRGGNDRKVDHDRTNDQLASGYERVVGAVGERYDPLVTLTNAEWHPIDNVAGLEVVREWREAVYRNAERLVNAKSDAEREEITAQIEANAAGWAESIRATPQPGYRAQRDAYCRAQLAD